MSHGFTFRAAKLHDLDPGVNSEFNLGVNLRASGPTGGGASVEVGTLGNPLIVKQSHAETISDGYYPNDFFGVYAAAAVYSAIDGKYYFSRQAQTIYSGVGMPATGLPAVALHGYFNSSKTSETNANNTYNHVQIGDRQQVFVTIRDDAAGVELGTAASPLFIAPGTAYKGSGVPAFVTIDVVHHEVHEGDHFLATDIDTDVDTGAAKYWRITTPATSKRAHLILRYASTGAGTWEFFENPTTNAAGTQLTMVNSNRNSATTATTVFYYDNTTTSDGTRLWADRTGSNGTGLTRNSGSGGREDELILKENEDYIIKFTPDADNTGVVLNVSWYEHTNV